MNPIDQLQSPTFSQICSFARLPYSKNLEGVDIAFLGLPFDDATTYRPGARFGPRAVREASCQMIKPFNFVLNVSPLKDLTIVDYGDVDVVPGYIEDTFKKIEKEVSEIVGSSTFPLCCGGDHSVTLPVLRTISKKYGKLSLIQFDSHTDCGDMYFGKKYNHGTHIRRAYEEGLIDPETSVYVGIRGGMYNEMDIKSVENLGFNILTIEDVYDMGIKKVIEKIHNTVKNKTYVTLDIDVCDPAFAPGTGTPEVGGLQSREIIKLVRGLVSIDIVGFDLVEVSPPYDISSITSMLASWIFFEFLSVMDKGRSEKC